MFRRRFHQKGGTSARVAPRSVAPGPRFGSARTKRVAPGWTTTARSQLSEVIFLLIALTISPWPTMKISSRPPS
jgi:hypothetical protein